MADPVAAPPAASRRVHLAATPGGHLDLLLALAPAFGAYDRVWVTAPGSAADALSRDGERVCRLPRFHGFSSRLGSYAWAAARLVRQERPRFVVSSGSGSVAPFCAIACASGAHLMFLETMARIEDASRAGKLLSKLASSVVVQWPEMAEVYPGAVVARPALLEERASTRPSDGKGTLVVVGTHIDPFDRLLRFADDAVGAGMLPRPGVAQTGSSTHRPRRMASQQWMTPDELQSRIDSAEYVVCHAGSGVIARCLRAGHKPLVLPRLRRHGEHVDDHQLQLARRLSEMGCVVTLQGPIRSADVAAADEPPSPATASMLPAMQDVVEQELTRLVRS